MKEKVQNARIDRNVVVLGSIAQEERDFNGLARGQHAFSLRSASVPAFSVLLQSPGARRTSTSCFRFQVNNERLKHLCG
jgi:hypothetical protein